MVHSVSRLCAEVDYKVSDFQIMQSVGIFYSWMMDTKIMLKKTGTYEPGVNIAFYS
jgi:hypothetical protein